MTGQEYADTVKFTKIEPNQHGFYEVNMDLVRSIASMAYTQGKIDGMMGAYDKLSAAQRKETADVISQG